MKSSRYEDLATITPGRVAGYMRDNSGWRNADYLSMSQPYSAGSLISTVVEAQISREALSEPDPTVRP